MHYECLQACGMEVPSGPTDVPLPTRIDTGKTPWLICPCTTAASAPTSSRKDVCEDISSAALEQIVNDTRNRVQSMKDAARYQTILTRTYGHMRMEAQSVQAPSLFQMRS